MLLKEIVESKHVLFIDHADGWEDAIRLSCKTLVADGAVDASYAEEIIAAVKELGPYIVLMPGFALPHAAKNSTGVHATAIGFMRLAHPVSFDDSNPEKKAQVFFTLAAVGDENHLKNMRKLWKMLTDETLCAELLKVESEEDLLVLDKKYS